MFNGKVVASEQRIVFLFYLINITSFNTILGKDSTEDGLCTLSTKFK